MSTAASPAASEGESKRGEVTYRFCQDWYVLPSPFDLTRYSLTRPAAQTSFIPRRTARPHNFFSYAKRATPPRCLIMLVPTAINSAPTSPKLLVSPLMLQMIPLYVMIVLCCLVSVQCAEIKSGVDCVKKQHWRHPTRRTCHAIKAMLPIYSDPALQRSHPVEAVTD